MVLRGGTGPFRFRIVGKTLWLSPLLTPSLKRQALAHPLRFSAAGRIVGVAYEGHAWRRVPCATRC
jgi:hypothetical protein